MTITVYTLRHGGLLCVVRSRETISVRGKGIEWSDEPMLSCSRGKPGRNRDICRGRSRVDLGSPWMLWMPQHMGFNRDQDQGVEREERERKSHSANSDVTVRF